MKIVLAEDHLLVRDGLRRSISQLDAEMEIIEAGNYAEVSDAIDSHPDIDLILLDHIMPGMDKLGGFDTVRKRAPDVPIVMLSAEEDPTQIHALLSRGARGYITKTSSTEVMLSAIRLVLAGGTYVPADLLGLQIGAEHGVPAEAPADDETPAGLTRRQLEVLALLMEGKSNKAIGRELNISDATVNSHTNMIFRHLNVHNRTEAVLAASRLGLPRSGKPEKNG